MQNQSLALALHEQLGNKQYIAINYIHLGNIYLVQNDLDKALALQNRALELSELIAYKEGMATAYANLGEIYQTQNEKIKARICWQKSIKLFNQLDMPEARAVQSWLDALQ